MSGIPVKITLSLETFTRFERIARRHGLTRIAPLIEEIAERAVTPRPAPVASESKHARRLTDAQRSQIRELTALGYSGQRIAAHVGCSIGAVKYWRKATNLENRSQ